MQQPLGLSVTLCRAPGWWLRAEQEPEAAPQALSILFGDQTDVGREHRRSEPMGALKGERALQAPGQAPRREPVQEGGARTSHAHGGLQTRGHFTLRRVILPQLCLSGTTSSSDRCSAECVKVTQLRCGGTTCV